MGISRREFLQGAAVFSFGGYSNLPFEFAPFASKHPLNIIQGPTNETTTQVAVDLPSAFRVAYELTERSTGRRLHADVVQTSTRYFSSWRTDIVRFENLRLGEIYDLQVVDKSRQVVDQRELKTLDTRKTNARVAFVSCQLDISLRKEEMWRHVQNTNPDVIFLQGDNVYGDILSRLHGPMVLWFRYIASRNVIPFYHWKRLVPAIAVWDDHDFGKNDVNGNYKHREHSLETFEGFYAQKPIAGFFERGPGVSSAVELFGHKILFLDGRYWRREPGMFGEGFLGDIQLEWVREQLSKNNKPLWFASGSQFFGGYQQGASYEEIGGSGEFDAFKQLVRSTNQPLLFSSGDLHYSELMELRREEFGFAGYEMTSSCLHSKLDKHLPENRRRTEGTLKENFMFLDFNDGEPDYDLTCIGIGEKIRFEKNLRF